MKALKQVGLRLPEELLARVDESASLGRGESRSEALRELIVMGLERELLFNLVAGIEERLDRMDLALERVHELAYTSVWAAVNGPEKLKGNTEYVKAKSKTDLANILVERFGE